MRNLFIMLQYPRVVCADILYKKARKIKAFNGKPVAQLLDEDMVKYNMKHSGINKPGIKLLNYLLISKPLFRSNFYFRINDTKLHKSLLKVISLMLLKPYNNIELGGKIDGGLHIIHNMGCVVVPEVAGKNLTVYQGGVVAYSPSSKDSLITHAFLGDNVTIFSNAVIAGNISIGDNCVIGAGSVVLKSVPDDCTVVGNPARIIRKNGEKVNIDL